MTRRQGKHYLPHPTPEGILGSWERSAELAGFGGKVDWRGVARIAHLDGATVEWTSVKGPWRKQRPVGFVGEVVLVAAPHVRQRLHQLAVIGSNAGTGAHTTFGMGFTELIDVEPCPNEIGGMGGHGA
jgi:CRISPR/Cas system endoribonuclease Cas6 (RAMP superfamily)